VPVLDSFVGDVAAHEGLLEGKKDFFTYPLKFLGVFHRFLRVEGRGFKQKFIKKNKIIIIFFNLKI
jgi:hypothetical protein